MEAHYRLNPPRSVERIDEDGRHDLSVPYAAAAAGTEQTWGYHGSGPNATAATLLLDACGNEIPGDLIIAAQELVDELLSRLSQSDEHVIGIRELRAWVDEELPGRLERRAKEPQTLSAGDLRERLPDYLEQRAKGSWFEQYRAANEAPDTTE